MGDQFLAIVLYLSNVLTLLSSGRFNDRFLFLAFFSTYCQAFMQKIVFLCIF